MQRQLLAADRPGQHAIHRGGSPGQRGQRSAIGETGPGARHAAAGSAALPMSPRPDAAAWPNTPSFPVPSVSCQPLGRGCDRISTSTGGATSVKGLNAVDSASLATNPNGDIEPPDQGLCAGNGSVVETNNIGEILVFNTALKRQSQPIPLDTIMGLTKLGWSSGGDPSCVYDSANGGHWFFTQIVSASSEANGGAFTGCFAGVANACSRGHRGNRRQQPVRPLPRVLLPAPTTTRASRVTRPC